MAVTRLKRKDRRNKAVANNKVAAIKILKRKPIIKLVDVEEIKASILKDVKEELKSLIPEKKSLTDAPADNPLETKATPLTFYDRVCNQIKGGN